ncbi:MAG: hypothetical protein WB680_15440 [Candidatus Acidiferrales bacterium]
MLAIFTAASLIVAIVLYRRQSNAQIFLEYTKRYSDVMNMFPPDGRKARLNLFAEPPAESNNLSLAVLRYLNLCSEEFYLCKKKYLSNHVWKIWEAELKRTLSSPLVVREWAAGLSDEFQSYPEFLKYVEKAQRERPTAASRVAPNPSTAPASSGAFSH